MSRSNPNENTNPNPAVRWHEWQGEQGIVRYYDKDTKRQVPVGPPFTFILLDQLGSVRGWHDASDSGIYSNEVKDTRQDAMVVKSFKGGVLAEGIYKDIKDRVNAMGGQFVANCYIAFKDDSGELRIGSLRFKGAALGAWMEFCKANKAQLYKQGIKIDGYTEGTKGRVVFRVPTLKLVPISEQTDQAAIALDAELQEFLRAYLKRNTTERADYAAAHEPEPDPVHEPHVPSSVTDDDIPF